VTLVPSFVDLLQPLSVAMTVPTFDNLRTVLTGWVYARRRTVTGMIVAADAAGRKHHSAFHRLFASASWSLDALGLSVFALIEPWLGTDTSVMLALDDTLARKRGVTMFGVGMHHDPLISSRKTAVVNRGHSWVVLSVLVRFPFCQRRCFALPILLRLYLNMKSAAKHRRVYRTRPQLAVQMLGVLCRAYKDRRFHAIADSAYGGQSVLNRLPDNCDPTSRLLLDARL
jgi:DDE superfamily endonuclease